MAWPYALGQSRGPAPMGLLRDGAGSCEARLPGTKARRCADRTISRHKAEIISIRRRPVLLDAAEAARAAEAEGAGPGRPGWTPGGLRAAIARAVIAAAHGDGPRSAARPRPGTPGWSGGPQDTGNAALLGRELPPDEVLAADQRITWWAGELKKAGLDGGTDVLRARAFLDLLLGKDSRLRQASDGHANPGPEGGSGGEGSGGDPAARGRRPRRARARHGPAGPAGGVRPAGSP